MPQTAIPENDCPRCGGGVRRVHRRTHEAQTLSGSGLRRYRCEVEGCGWQGLLVRTSPRLAGRASQTPLSGRWRLWAVAVVVLVLLGLLSAGLALMALQPDGRTPDGGQPVKSL